MENKSRQCQECVRFTKKKCKGKAENKTVKTFFGQNVSGLKPVGLNFCKDYELDEEVVVLKESALIEENYQTIKKRAIKNRIKKENKEYSEDVDLAETLSSSDFADLLI